MIQTTTPRITQISTEGIDNELSSVSVPLSFSQDLHGYDKPWIGGTGKNLLARPFYGDSGTGRESFTRDGITYTVSQDGHIRGVGTTERGTNYYFEFNMHLLAGVYTLSFTGKVEGVSLRVYDYQHAITLGAIGSTVKSQTFTVDEDCNVRVYFNQGAAGFAVDIDASVMLEKRESLVELYLDRTFHQGITYSLADDVLHVSGTAYNMAFSGGDKPYDSCPWKLPAGTYTISGYASGVTDGGYLTIGYVKQSAPTTYYKTTVWYVNAGGFSKTLSFNEDGGLYFWIYTENGSTVDYDITFAIVGEPSAYEPWENICPIIGESSASVNVSNADGATDYTSTFQQTIYGGNADILNGSAETGRGALVLTGTESGYSFNGNTIRFEHDFHALSLNASEHLSNRMLSVETGNAFGTFKIGTGHIDFGNVFDGGTRFANANEFKTFLTSNNLQIVYKLSTTASVSITDNDIILNYGTNTFTAEGKNVTVSLTDGRTFSGASVSVIGKEVQDITEGIENGSLDLYECLCQNPFEFGKLTSDKLEFRLYRDIDLSGKEITVTQTIDGASVPIFSGIVDECKRDNLNTYRNVVAYDKAESLRDLSVSSWWESFWINKTSTTLLQLLTSLCSEFSLTLSKTTTVNDNLTVYKSMELEDGALTFGDILTYICELMCVFPHINRSGALELIAPWNISASGYISVTDKYEPGNTEFEEYTTDAITAVYCIEDGVTRGSAGTGTNAVSIVNNPLLYDVPDGNISSAMANILTALNGYSFTPATIQMIISGPDLPLGSMVSHSRGKTLVVENHLYSSQLFEQEIGVSVERTHGVDASYRPDVRRISGRIMNAESRLEVDEDKISMVVEGTGTSKKIKAAAIITAINGDESEVSIQAEKIRLNGYTDINGYFSVAEDGKVTLRDCLLDINSGSYDGQQIVLNGTVTGGGYYDGQTFSNAQKIGSNVIKNITTGIGANFQFDGMQVAKGQNPLVIVNGTTYQGNTAGQVFVLSTADSQIGAGQAVLQPHLLNITNGGKTVEITPEYETVNGTKRIYKAVDYSMSAGETAYIQVPVINATGMMYVTLYNTAGYACGGSVISVVSYRNSSAAKANIAVLQNYIDPIEGISEPPTYYFNASQATADYLPILARCSGAIRYKVCFEMYTVA